MCLPVFLCLFFVDYCYLLPSTLTELYDQTQQKKALVSQTTPTSKLKILENSELIGCLTGTGITSKNYKTQLTLGEFLSESPLSLLGLDIERDKDVGRPLDL